MSCTEHSRETQQASCVTKPIKAFFNFSKQQISGLNDVLENKENGFNLINKNNGKESTKIVIPLDNSDDDNFLGEMKIEDMKDNEINKYPIMGQPVFIKSYCYSVKSDVKCVGRLYYQDGYLYSTTNRLLVDSHNNFLKKKLRHLRDRINKLKVIVKPYGSKIENLVYISPTFLDIMRFNILNFVCNKNFLYAMLNPVKYEKIKNFGVEKIEYITDKNIIFCDTTNFDFRVENYVVSIMTYKGDRTMRLQLKANCNRYAKKEYIVHVTNTIWQQAKRGFLIINKKKVNKENIISYFESIEFQNIIDTLARVFEQIEQFAIF